MYQNIGQLLLSEKKRIAVHTVLQKKLLKKQRANFFWTTRYLDNDGHYLDNSGHNLDNGYHYLDIKSNVNTPSKPSMDGPVRCRIFPK